MERIQYGEAGGVPLMMLMERPSGCAPGDRRVCVVWVHGGGWHAGEAAQFTRHIAHMAAKGAVSVSIEYGLTSAGASVSDCLADCQEAIRWLRANAHALGIDPARIIAAGDSAGGHLACCLGSPALTPDPRARANRVVNMNGVVDVTGRFLPHIVPESRLPAESAEAWLAWMARAEALSPVHSVTGEHAPILHVQGLDDPVVLPQETLRYHRALQAAGVSSELWLLPGINHAFIVFDYHLENGRVEEILRAIGDWMLNSR